MLIRLLLSIILSISIINASTAIPNKIYLLTPFLCQAPFGNWSEPWQDACEEASIIMALKKFKDKGSGNQEILKLVEFQKQHYGGHFDLTAAKAVKLIKDYYKYDKVKLINDPSIEDIKTELANKNIVVAPMAGRLLGNPCYTPPGPAYHYMLFKGYNDRTGKFITNDCGTKRGKDYRYKYRTAYNAIHDWTGSKKTIAKGKKVIIVFESGKR